MAMADALRLRGPDEYGVWIEPEAGLAMSHRRLSIIDLSIGGRQPMTSASGRYVICFNGEIYNFPELRRRLVAGGSTFKGGSDTEVLLEAIDSWGIDAALVASAGMFAFALWDRSHRRLTLARDRCGEKPMYYGRVGTALVFASELKAFRDLPGWPNPIDEVALAHYFRHGCVPAPFSIHAGIRKLPPGAILELSSPVEQGQLRQYWDYRALAEPGPDRPMSDADSVDELDRLLAQSIRGCMLSDVPIGAFLSGGIDSATVVALMQAQSSVPVRTFTMGFGDPGYDEAALAVRSQLIWGHDTPRSTSVLGMRWVSCHGSRRYTTSRSPTSRRYRPSSSPGSPARTSPCACPGMGPMSCSVGITGTTPA